MIHDVCKAIVKVLMKCYIKFPVGEELKEVVNGLMKIGDFQIVVELLIDVTLQLLHLLTFTVTSITGKDDFLWFFKEWQTKSITLLMSTQDGLEVYMMQEYLQIHQQRIEGSLFNGLKKSICSKDVPVCLLDDSAYPLKSWLLKPFPHNGLLTHSQQCFNYRLSKARIVVESTYGQLKGRWGCLTKRLDAKPENISIIIMACCILITFVRHIHSDL